jgi:hypothetical protein
MIFNSTTEDHHIIQVNHITYICIVASPVSAIITKTLKCRREHCVTQMVLRIFNPYVMYECRSERSLGAAVHRRRALIGDPWCKTPLHPRILYNKADLHSM